ncbi:hypothetical protein LWI29_004709 [Acer saccharum]|uniref:GAG-pre-integrase domain-containing protein n=1 Tax=Acer saccharum TaxID=4024 RepID=A0AA39VBS6_ACESA|nr:hypothetical protein LWI29_004709 [Acer saccharum]
MLLLVNMGNGVKVKIDRIGVAKLVISIGHFLELNDIVYIPSIRRNLISVSILDRAGYAFRFGNGKVFIYYNNVHIGSGTLCDGLYMIDLHPNIGQSFSSSTVHAVNNVVGSKHGRIDENSPILWHRRLGHISRQRIERLIKDGILHKLDFSDFGTCVDCVKGTLTAKTRKPRVD